MHPIIVFRDDASVDGEHRAPNSLLNVSRKMFMATDECERASGALQNVNLLPSYSTVDQPTEARTYELTLRVRW